MEIKWLVDVEDHDYPAAESYLNLIFDNNKTNELVNKLKESSVETFKAKDILRATQLSLLGISNSHVEKDTKKIKDGKKLSPILLVRDEVTHRLIIADGYHRLCAVYSLDEDATIPCKII